MTGTTLAAELNGDRYAAAAMKPRRDDGDDGSPNSSRLTSNVTVPRET